jgi:hypothetical protein
VACCAHARACRRIYRRARVCAFRHALAPPSTLSRSHTHTHTHTCTCTHVYSHKKIQTHARRCLRPHMSTAFTAASKTSSQCTHKRCSTANSTRRPDTASRPCFPPPNRKRRILLQTKPLPGCHPTPLYPPKVALFEQVALALPWLGGTDAWFFDCIPWEELMRDINSPNGTCLIAPTRVLSSEARRLSWVVDKEGGGGGAERAFLSAAWLFCT